MSIFKKMIKEIENYEKAIDSFKETPTPEPEEEWIWVEGYKGTDVNMQCNGYQYELGVQHDIPDDQKVVECECGFHLCLTLHDVFGYYDVGAGHRFFKVKALVRKSDKYRYGTYEKCKDSYGYTITGNRYDKLVSKSIIFQSELTCDEILKSTDAANLPTEYKKMAIEFSIKNAVDEYKAHTLLEDGYSKPFAAHIIKVNKFDIAHAFGSQNDLSMDMKVLGILYNT